MGPPPPRPPKRAAVPAYARGAAHLWCGRCGESAAKRKLNAHGVCWACADAAVAGTARPAAAVRPPVADSGLRARLNAYKAGGVGTVRRDCRRCGEPADVPAGTAWDAAVCKVCAVMAEEPQRERGGSVSAPIVLEE